MSDVLSRLPSEVRLAGSVGPTLFTREAQGGELRTLAAFDSALAEHEHAGSLVIGTIRETQGPATAYAAFCIEPRMGHIVLVDLDPPHRARFVNSRIEQLMSCLMTAVAGWPRFVDDEAGLDALHAELAAIDPAALRDDDAFWPTYLENSR
jgi:hypothetical protein